MTEGAAVSARVVRTDEGEPILAAGVEHLFKLTGDQTSGRFGLERFVLQGELTVANGDGDVVLGPGDLAQAERGSVHERRLWHCPIRVA